MSDMFPMDDAQYARTYAAEAAMVDASEAIAEALEKSNLSRADLARSLGVSPSEVTARLQGERNISVRKLAETLHALGGKLKIGVEEFRAHETDVVLMAWKRRAAETSRPATSIHSQAVADFAAYRHTEAS